MRTLTFKKRVQNWSGVIRHYGYRLKFNMFIDSEDERRWVALRYHHDLFYLVVGQLSTYWHYCAVSDKSVRFDREC